MRGNIIHPGAGELHYEIRSIVAFAKQLQTAGVDIKWENIGDPVAKGETVPDWLTEIVSNEAKNSASYGYSPTKGLDSAREYLARTRTEESGNELLPENIIFFNGLGDAISKVYTWLNPICRVLGPSPAYPTHSSVEGAHGRSRHLTYKLDPHNDWLPDMEDIRNQVRYNPAISALLVINPDNPTGVVYPPEVLKQFVQIAKEFDLFLIADEIYAKMVYDGVPYVSLADVAENVPTMIMRGLSKEVPWPGSRCGWIEFYNTQSDWQFERYVKSIEEAKMIEVCSTTLPQAVIPQILGDERYHDHVRRRVAKYQRRSEQAAKVLNQVDGLQVIPAKGAFYLTIHFENHLLSRAPRFTSDNRQAQNLLSEQLASYQELEYDQKFAYNLLASTGVCTVPMTSGFNSHAQGIRITLLEEDDAAFTNTLERIAEYTRSLA